VSVPTVNDLITKLNETRDIIKNMPASERLLFTEHSLPKAGQPKWEIDIMYAYRNACFILGIDKEKEKKPG